MGGTTLIAGGDKNQLGKVPRQYVQENTIASFRQALLHTGVDGIEFDVQVTKDGIPVILHGDDIARYIQGMPTGGKMGQENLAKFGKISERNWADIKDIDIGGGAKIPSLAELYEAIGEINKERKAKGWAPAKTKVEFKPPVQADGSINEPVLFAKRVTDVIDRAMVQGQISSEDLTYQSFERPILEALAADKNIKQKLVLAIRTGLAYNPADIDAKGRPALGAAYLPEFLDELETFVKANRISGIEPASFGDVGQPLIDLTHRLKLELHLCFSNLRYVNGQGHKGVGRIARQVNVVTQADDPELFRLALDKVDPKIGKSMVFTRTEKQLIHQNVLKEFLSKADPAGKKLVLDLLDADGGPSILQVHKIILDGMPPGGAGSIDLAGITKKLERLKAQKIVALNLRPPVEPPTAARPPVKPAKPFAQLDAEAAKPSPVVAFPAKPPRPMAKPNASVGVPINMDLGQLAKMSIFYDPATRMFYKPNQPRRLSVGDMLKYLAARNVFYNPEAGTFYQPQVLKPRVFSPPIGAGPPLRRASPQMHPR